jgi:hypothetical protein
MKTDDLKMMLAAVLSLFCITNTARADDYPCQVLLCLSDKRGPETESQCRPPINRLKRDLAMGRPMPICEMASGSSAVLEHNYYDVCPVATTHLAAGKSAVPLAAPTTPVAHPSASPYRYSSVIEGIGDGSTVVPQYVWGGGTEPMPDKVCVAGHSGNVTLISGQRYAPSIRAGIYSTIVQLPAHTNPQVITVRIEGVVYNQVRF